MALKSLYHEFNKVHDTRYIEEILGVYERPGNNHPGACISKSWLLFLAVLTDITRTT